MPTPRAATRALSIRQPYAQLILRGIKTVEFRTRPTRIIGERFYLYASEKPATALRPPVGKAWSRDLAMAIDSDAPPAYNLELARHLVLGDLPTGVLVGSAIIECVSPPADGDGLYRWQLVDVERATVLRKPRGHPQPAWFMPFPIA